MSDATSSSTSTKGRLTSRPRVCGTTQKLQTLSQPFITVTNSLTFPAELPGSARGKTYSSESTQAVSDTRTRSAMTRFTSSGSLPMASGPKTKSRYGTRARSLLFSCCATQPPTARSAPRCVFTAR